MTDAVVTRAHGPTAQRAPFVLVGGVPGAGKSTALARVPGARVVDTESSRRRLRSVLGPGVPYAVYRPLVHARHAVLVVGALLAGPGRAGAGGLCVHDPATRRWRRSLVARLARARGWRPVLVMVDVTRDEALAGQTARGRVVRARSFERHWRRWAAERDRMVAVAGRPAAGWDRLHVVDRRGAAALLRRLLVPGHAQGRGAGHGAGHEPVGTVPRPADDVRVTHSSPASTHRAAAPHQAGS